MGTRRAEGNRQSGDVATKVGRPKLAYWGGARADVFAYDTQFATDMARGIDGLCDRGERLITLRCVGILPHEIGHAVIDDPDHTDPRWVGIWDLEVAAGRLCQDSQAALPPPTE